jgi:alkylation response protein AidB-like acyl-CoA dehydrogenase
MKSEGAGVSARESLHEMIGRFGERAAKLEHSDEFVAANYDELRSSGMLAAGVPGELGGLGMEVPELADILKAMARACPSTALAFSMHTHTVAVGAWRWKNQQAPLQPMLEKVAKERVVLITSGGGDWLDSSGEAVPADGGYRVSARKSFCSGVPAGDIFVSSAVVKDGRGEGQREVIHFPVSLKAQGVHIEPTWKALGMRNTGSHDVVLQNVLIGEAAVHLRRPAGKWHPLFDLVCLFALPLVYAVYLGVAQSARERTLGMVRKRKATEALQQDLGEMENQLRAAELAHADWIACAAAGKPGRDSTNRAMIDRTLTARGVLGTVEAAMNAAGGAAFYRSHGLEQLFRDAQGARFHQPQEGPQRQFTARTALGPEV